MESWEYSGGLPQRSARSSTPLSMWSHLIQLMRARRALRAGRYDSVLSLLEDPLVREDRRAVDLRARVLGELCDRAQRRMQIGQLDLASRDLDRVMRADPDHSRRQTLEDELKQLSGKDREEREQREALLAGDFLGLLRMGANIYFMAKLAVPSGVSVQDVGAQFQNITTEEFKANLAKNGEGLEEKLEKLGGYWNG